MSTDTVTVERVAQSADELSLLAGIADHPADDLRRLVYADWLDEQGDPRGPLLRQFIEAVRAGAELPSLDGVPAAWADLTGITWTRHIVAAGLAHKRDMLLALARPALRLDAGEPDFDAPPPTPAAVGTTRLGGDPDLPAGTGYPTDYDGVPLYFLGQFDLADLQGTVAGRAFPAAGLLSIFRVQDNSYNSIPYDVDLPRLVRLTPPGRPLTRLARPKPEFTSGSLASTVAITSWTPTLGIFHRTRIGHVPPPV